MAKITEYPEAQSFDAGDVILKDGIGGTKKMTVETLKTLIAPEVDTTLTQEGKAADAKKAGDEIRGIKSAINPIAAIKHPIEHTGASGYIGNNVSIGSTVSLSPHADASYEYWIIPCVEGDTFDLHASGAGTTSGAARVWSFIDADNLLLSLSTYGEIDAVITAPANAAKLIVNNKLSGGYVNWLEGQDGFLKLKADVDILQSALLRLTCGPARRLHVDDSAGGIPLRSATVTITNSMSSFPLRICKNNLYHGMVITDHSALNKDTGNISSASGEAVTDYIDVRGINNIVELYDESATGGWYHIVCKYDADKQFISGERTTQSGGYKYFTTAVADAAYVRISTVRNLMVSGCVMICASDNITNYTVQMGHTIAQGYVNLLAGKAYDTSGDEPVSYDITPLALVSYDEPWDIMAHFGISEATYIADATKAYKSSKRSLQSIIAGIETSTTASHAYDIGNMLIMGDDLYRVIAAIANGGTITVGTNVTKTTVAEQLVALANA